MDDRRDPSQPDRRKTARVGGRRANDPPPDWISISAFARKYGVDRSIVYKWLRAQVLDTYEVGTLLRIRNLPPDQHVRRMLPDVDGRVPAKPQQENARDLRDS